MSPTSPRSKLLRVSVRRRQRGPRLRGSLDDVRTPADTAHYGPQGSGRHTEGLRGERGDGDPGLDHARCIRTDDSGKARGDRGLVRGGVLPRAPPDAPRAVRPGTTWCNTDRPRGGPRRARPPRLRPDTRTGTSFALEFLSHRSCEAPARHDPDHMPSRRLFSPPLRLRRSPYPPLTTTRTWYSPPRRLRQSASGREPREPRARGHPARVCPPSSPPPWRRAASTWPRGRRSRTPASSTGEVLVVVLETRPWACRVARPGAVAEVLGTKDTVDAAVAVFPGTSENLDVYAKRAPDAADRGRARPPKCASPPARRDHAFANINGSGIRCDDRGTGGAMPGRTPGARPPPLLYETAPDDLACDATSAEIATPWWRRSERDRRAPWWTTCRARAPCARGSDSYGHDPNLDKTSTATMMRTNPAPRGLTHPMRFVERKKSGDVSSRDAEHSAEFENSKHRKKTSENLLVPDFSHRYVAEDVGYGPR